MQAILISAYKDPEYLKRLINFFSKDFRVFVHIDKKSNINREEIKLNANVYVYKKFVVSWGGINHLRAILFLMQEALKKDKSVSYIHIISGSDIPVKKIEDFNKFENCEKIYMEHMKVEDLKSNVINRRYQYGNRLPYRDPRKRSVRVVNKIYEILHRPNSKIGKFQASQLYKGLIWLSLPRKAAEYVIDYEKKNDLVKQMKYITVPEEFFFQTILENSSFKSKIAPNNLVYNDWSEPRYNSLPAILDESDYKKISNGTYFFARKIDMSISKELVKKISNEINKF